MIHVPGGVELGGTVFHHMIQHDPQFNTDYLLLEFAV